ncbi:MAG TPA: flagellar assembly protein FliH [Bacillales bacterium]|nr:flagellar assembly protein FliH [Bacillales bacterium]
MSKVIKSPYTQTEDGNKRVIKLKPFTGELPYFADRYNESEETQEKTIDLRQVEAEAEEIIRNAEKEAILILRDAENKLQEIIHQVEVEKQNWNSEKEHWIETAKQDGYADGLEVGRQDGVHEFKTLIDTAKDNVILSKQDYLKNVEQSEATILHLGLKAAEKIIGFTLELNEDVFLNLVKQVIKEVKDHQDILIHVHPKYYGLLISQKEEIKAYFNNPTTQIYVFPDDELRETDCIIESSFGRIDASIDSQLNELKLKLLQILEGEMEDENC